jgi:ATP synthase protein I
MSLVYSGRVIAKKQVKTAIFATLILMVVWYFVEGYQAMYSALLAGITVIVPQLIFAFKAFQYAGAQASEKVVKAFFQGEKIKMVLTVVFVVIVFSLLSVQIIPFITSYSIVVVMPLLSGFFIKL